METKDLKVEVYYNLHKKCLSVRACFGRRRVVAHCDHIVLRDATFHVSEAGRQRVLREKRKNVHAVVRGYVSPEFLRRLRMREFENISPGMVVASDDKVVNITYNPYKFRTFVRKVTETKVTSAELVEIEGRTIRACNPE